ncbi:uncharacterized protein STAUR_0104 [Stigmatella aurantiaca DW4/3-1]|uniref:Uncharacterized protein n=1 Tax=Stigmatella aurantiaca (strain DW4/3-1) TaxID=378806 RepID=E3FKE0_STIAD|nr:uncharacterized protein STAUR_0104 [Stigmatella aurantiaca DW4/3-1]
MNSRGRPGAGRSTLPAPWIPGAGAGGGVYDRGRDRLRLPGDCLGRPPRLPPPVVAHQRRGLPDAGRAVPRLRGNDVLPEGARGVAL